MSNETLAWPSEVSHSTRARRRRTPNWKKHLLLLLVFFSVSLILKIILEYFHRLRSQLPGSTAGREQWRLMSCFLPVHVGLKTPTDLCGGAADRTRSHQLGQTLPVSYPLTALTFFSMLSVLFFYSKNMEKMNTKKKNHKKTWKKYKTKTIMSH